MLISALDDLEAGGAGSPTPTPSPNVSESIRVLDSGMSNEDPNNTPSPQPRHHEPEGSIINTRALSANDSIGQRSRLRARISTITVVDIYSLEDKNGSDSNFIVESNGPNEYDIHHRHSSGLEWSVEAQPASTTDPADDIRTRDLLHRARGPSSFSPLRVTMPSSRPGGTHTGRLTTKDGLDLPVIVRRK